jgi:hypothetical protein
MPLDALPERLQTAEAWKNTDMDNIFQRWIIKNPWIHGLLAYGPRSKHKWACWRTIPKVLFAIKGEGPWRWEHDEAPTLADYDKGVLKDKTLSHAGYYLSRIQYWCRWHFSIQWPFIITFHVYFKKKDIMPVELSTSHNLPNNTLIYFYIGAHRDGDVVYWFPSAFLGGTWK